jgi:glycerol-3-phosphate dehydrogenase (NAD(P)+)
MSRIAILGAGSWGTALAVHLARIGHDVAVWGRNPSVVAAMHERRANAVYLPDIVLPHGVSPTSDLAVALEGARFVVLAVPSHNARAVLRLAAGGIDHGTVVVSATKGLEGDTHLRMSEVVRQELQDAVPVAVLSGPSFAIEVARQLPTAVAVACADADACRRVQHEFRGPFFRLYAGDDVVGVEIGGALKNVIAIAAGVVEALGLGHNALAALITRGLAEISRLACAVGGRRETLAGLSGLGDLVLTCTGELSRNRHVGVELGKGRPLAEVLAGMQNVAEGVRTTGAALALGAAYSVELPIAAQMADVLAGRKRPQEAVEELMLRRQKFETL